MSRQRPRIASRSGGLPRSSGSSRYTAGQEARGATDQYYSFTQKGLTHVDISASTTIAVAAMAIAPAVHLQLSPSGQNTRAVGALARNADRGAKLWFGFDLGWAHAFDKR